MGRQTHGKPKFKDVAEFAEKSRLTDDALGRLIGLDRTAALRIRRGMKFLSLRTPLRIARVCSVPIESLAPKDAA